jgi:hypothetical protein
MQADRAQVSADTATVRGYPVRVIRLPAGRRDPTPCAFPPYPASRSVALAVGVSLALLSAAPAAHGQQDAAGCQTWKPGQVTGALDRGDINEASGLAASARNEGLLWTHNDSGDRPRVFAITPSGRVLASYRLLGAKAWDWEDIAVSGDGHGGGPYIYAADIGDNRLVRPFVVVYRVEEPAVSASPQMRDLEGTKAFELVYPDGPHNAEVLLVDPRSGDLFIVTKDFDSGTSRVYRSSFPHDAGRRRLLEDVGRVQFPGSRARDIAATGGDVSSRGDRILIRTYTRTFVWSRNRDESLAHALMTVPCSTATVGFGLPIDQYESIAFSRDGQSYYTLGEGSGSPLYRFDTSGQRPRAPSQ